MRLTREKGFSLQGSINIGLKQLSYGLMSPYSSFQNDWCIRVRGQADQVLLQSCLVPAIQVNGGSAIVKVAAA